MQPPGPHGGWGPPPGGFPPGPPAPPYGGQPGPGWVPQGPGGFAPRPPAKKSNVGLILGLLVGAVVLLVGGCVTCIALMPPPDPAAQAKLAAERKATIETGTQRFLAIKAAFPSKLSEKTCPEGKIPKGSTDLHHHSLDYAFLERFSNPALDIEKGELKDFEYLTSMTLRGMEPPGKIKDFGAYGSGETARRFTDVGKGGVVIVVRADHRVVPRVSGDESFEGGEFDGWAVVFDLPSAAVLCMARVQAESSDEVSHRERGILKETAEEALRKDFQKQVEKELDRSLARISKNLSRSPY